MNIIKYWILRLRDILFPPRRLPELLDYSARKGKYAYLAEKANDDIRKSFRRRRNLYD